MVAMETVRVVQVAIVCAMGAVSPKASIRIMPNGCTRADGIDCAVAVILVVVVDTRVVMTKVMALTQASIWSSACMNART